MTASELAFLALGLLLGAASGAALIVVLGSRPNRREIRVTVTRDAVPRRSETLSHDAFLASPAEPARGGPGDRRALDRDEDLPDPPKDGWHPLPSRTAVPVAADSDRSAGPVDRTPVPSVTASFAVARGGAVGIAIEPEVDRDLLDLRRSRPHGAPLERMLRGDHRAMVEAIDAIAGEDGQQRRAWEVLLGGLVEVMADAAVEESVIDLPLGTAFWDTFTVEQCRRIVAALASMGHRYDGEAGWVDGRVPAYRDLTQALADVGIEPRRVRTWPNQSEIASLFVGARPAPDELLAAAGPEYDAEAMQGLLGDRAGGLAELWSVWDDIRPMLVSDPSEALADEGAATA